VEASGGVAVALVREAPDELDRLLAPFRYTVDEFAEVSGVKRWSIYNALKGRRIRDYTAIKIFRALEKRNPMPVVYEGLEVT
jgi:predicted transcriptional regulator